MDEDSKRRNALRSRALQKIGLTVESNDFNLQRILSLAQHAIGAQGARFSILEEDVLCGVVETRGALDCRVEDSPLAMQVIESGKPYANPDLKNLPVAELAAQKIRGNSLAAFCLMPVFDANKKPMGVLSMFSGNTHPRDKVDATLKFLNTYVRMIEDTLTLRALTVRDSLTQLFDRSYFEDQSRVEWRRALRMQIPLSFVLIDMDHFSSFNEIAGKHAGDLALKQVASILTDTCLRAGDMVCRYSGEQFAVILPMTPVKASMIVSEKIRAALEQAGIPHEGKGGVLTLSSGASTAETAEMLERGSLDTFMDGADRALFEAKRAGRNCCRHVNDLDRAD